MYLENFLRVLDPNANVKIYTEETYEIAGQEFQRCLGNHYIKNWERGLVGMREAFEVIEAKKETVYEEVPTWAVTVRCATENWVYRLERVSNNAAGVFLYQKEEVV